MRAQLGAARAGFARARKLGLPHQKTSGVAFKAAGAGGASTGRAGSWLRARAARALAG